MPFYSMYNVPVHRKERNEEKKKSEERKEIRKK